MSEACEQIMTLFHAEYRSPAIREIASYYCALADVLEAKLPRAEGRDQALRRLYDSMHLAMWAVVHALEGEGKDIDSVASDDDAG